MSVDNTSHSCALGIVLLKSPTILIAFPVIDFNAAVTTSQRVNFLLTDCMQGSGGWVHYLRAFWPYLLTGPWGLFH